MKIPNRPKLSDAETDKIVNYMFPAGIPAMLFLFVRGYFSTTIGAPGNDYNVWDDAAMIYAGGDLVRTFNANTDPAKLRQDLAMLDPGIYQFQKRVHKKRIKAFGAVPEGVRLPCSRQGKSGAWYKSFCSYIDIHDGGASDTWSAGCLTLPNWTGEKQFDEFRDLSYKMMDSRSLKAVTTLLITETTMREILALKANS